jgi:CDP-diacylglycerol--glycerol-3-phosphate 3-phosphatidyltransferase
MSAIHPEPVPVHEPKKGFLYRLLWKWGITPNQITIARAVLIPVVFTTVLLSQGWYAIIPTTLFLAAALSDRIDGELARRSGQVTSTGKWLDPMVDKGLTISTLLALFIRSTSWQWGVSLLLIFVFEGLSTTLREVIKRRMPSVNLGAQWWGKGKFVVQIAAISILILPMFSAAHPYVLAVITAVTVVADIATLYHLNRATKM